jgi:hypothetical protein
MMKKKKKKNDEENNVDAAECELSHQRQHQRQQQAGSRRVRVEKKRNVSSRGKGANIQTATKNCRVVALAPQILFRNCRGGRGLTFGAAPLCRCRALKQTMRRVKRDGASGACSSGQALRRSCPPSVA